MTSGAAKVELKNVKLPPRKNIGKCCAREFYNHKVALTQTAVNIKPLKIANFMNNLCCKRKFAFALD